MKRKIVAVVLASTMVFGMTACGSSGASDSSSTGSDAATDDTATDDGSEDANVTEGSSDDENTLTVWTWDPNFNIYAIEKAAEIAAIALAANGGKKPNQVIEDDQLRQIGKEFGVTLNEEVLNFKSDHDMYC